MHVFKMKFGFILVWSALQTLVGAQSTTPAPAFTVSEVTRQQAPRPPSRVLAVSVTTTSITLTWISPPDADSIEIERLDVDDSALMFEDTGITSPHVILDLNPGHRYNLTLYVRGSNGVRSIGAGIMATTIPAKPIGVHVQNRTSNSLEVVWAKGPGSIDSFGITFVDTGIRNWEETLIEGLNKSRYLIRGLMPGHNYSISVRSLSHGVQSEPVNVFSNTAPLAPQNVAVMAISTTELRVTWEPALGSLQSSYVVNYKVEYSGLSRMPSNCQGQRRSCVIDVQSAGKPGDAYVVSVFSVQGKYRSSPTSAIGNTKPNPPGEMNLRSRTPSSLTIAGSWPAISKVDNCTAVTPSGRQYLHNVRGVYSLQLTNLAAGTSYTIRLYCASGHERSDIVAIIYYTKPLTPVSVSRESATTDSLSVTWSPASGNFDRYELTLEDLQDNLPQNTGSPKILLANAERRTKFINLVPGTPYKVVLRTVVGPGVKSDPVTEVMHIKPLPAREMALVERGETNLVVRWLKPRLGDFTGYTAKIRGVSTPDQTREKGTNQVAFHSLIPGTSYEVEVITTSQDQQSVPLVASFYTNPSPPMTPRATMVSNSSIAVRWEPPQGSGGFERFRVWLWEGPKTIDSVIVEKATTSHIFTGLAPATRYVVRLQSLISDAESATVPLTVPTNPFSARELRVVSKTTTEVRFVWDPPAEGEVGEYTYTFQKDGDAESKIERKTPHNEREQVLYNLMPGATYTISVVAVTHGAYSVPSTLKVTLHPSKVQRVHVSQYGRTFLEIKWDQPDGVYDGFEIQWREIADSNVFKQSVERGTTTHQINQLSPGKTYRVSVYTRSRRESSKGEHVEPSTQPTSVGEIVKGEITSDSIQITWSEPSNSDFDGYELHINPNQGRLSLPITINRNAERTYTFRDLLPGAQYEVSMEVVKGNIKSDIVRESITTEPAAVEELKAVTTGITSIQLTWRSQTGSRQSVFKIVYGEVRNMNLMEKEEDAKPYQYDYRHELRSLDAGNTYTVNVYAVSDGVRGASQTVNQTTQPLAVESLKATAQDASSVELTWRTSGVSHQDGYNIIYRRRHPDPGHSRWSVAERVRQSPKLVNKLHPGAQYEFSVTAVSQGQESLQSTTYEYLYPLPPESVIGRHNLATNNSITVHWSYNSSRSYVTRWRLRYTSAGTSSWVDGPNSPLGVNTTEVTIRQLIPGTNYSVMVYAITEDGKQSKTAATGYSRVKPIITMEMRENRLETTNDTVAVTYTEENQPVDFNHYEFSINATDHEPVTKNSDVTDRKVKFRDLQAGYVYNVEAVTVSGMARSQSKSILVTTIPNPPIISCMESPEKMTLQIQKPAGMVDKYRVQCDLCHTKDVTVDADSYFVEFDALKPNKQYTFLARSLRKGKESLDQTQTCFTAQAPPGPVRFFNFTNLLPYQVTLFWDDPLEEERNGDIVGYLVTYKGWSEDNEVETGDLKLGANTYNTTVEIRPGFVYFFNIQANTTGLGNITTLEVSTPIGKPHFAMPRQKTTPELIKASHNSAKMRFVNPFTERNGRIMYYSVIVTSDVNDTGLETDKLATWQEAHNNASIKSYFTLKKCPNFFMDGDECWKDTGRRRTERNVPGRTVDFTVGGDGSCHKGGGYCNGPLNPSKVYYVGLRGYTTNSSYADTPFTKAIKTSAAPPSQLLTILLPVLLIAALLLIILIICCCCIKRGSSCCPGNLCPSKDPPTRLIDFPTKRRPESSRPVKVKEFANHFARMSADTNLLYAEEYEDLKQVGREQSCSEAELPVNRVKNRFTNILPYDSTRVKLQSIQEEEGTDYINANWMPGFNSKREFIVCQGPLPSTVDDFWRMLWELNCRAIVMLTKCVERSRERCHHYWPVDADPTCYGDIKVAVLNETKSPEWVITEFMVSKGEQSRKVKHFHYISWPDFDVPEKPQYLLRFIRLVRTSLSPEGGPIIAHCSAGVGRTGTFVALDQMLQEIRDDAEYIDVYGTVNFMRGYRSCIVQTEITIFCNYRSYPRAHISSYITIIFQYGEIHAVLDLAMCSVLQTKQYIFIHECLLCAIEGREDEDSPYPFSIGLENKAFEVSPTKPEPASHGSRVAEVFFELPRKALTNDDDEGIVS